MTKSDKRPWKILNKYSRHLPSKKERTRAFGTVETAVSAAIFEVLIEDVGSWIMVANWDDNVAYRVAHIIDGQILVQRMIWGPEGRWVMK